MEDQTPLYAANALDNAADNLWLYRVFRNRTYADLADDVLTAKLLADYENRKTQIDPTHLALLADKLRIPMRILLNPAKLWLLLDADTRRLIEREKGLA